MELDKLILKFICGKLKTMKTLKRESYIGELVLPNIKTKPT